MLAVAIGIILSGSFIPQVITKILIMGLGYTVILFVRDPFKLYIHDVILDNTPKEQHQTLLTTLEFGVKIITAGMGLGFSAILTGYPLVTVITLMFITAIIEIILSINLYKTVLTAKAK